MANYYFDQEKSKENLKNFFEEEKANLYSFGSKVNQTFEAYTFAATIKWYRDNGWSVKIVNPVRNGKSVFRLKFSTRGAPGNFSYAIAEKDNTKCQIRHQLRVSTRPHRENNEFPANICCDVVVHKDADLKLYSTSDALPNEKLISFAEVKHMSAFAELIAGFIGMVHELQPDRLKRIRIRGYAGNDHISSFLNISGILWHTAKGLKETISKRKYDIDIYSFEEPLN